MMIESMGGAAVKLGQQLSLRRDVLDDIYCDELENLLDESEIGIPRKHIERVFQTEIGALDSVFSPGYDFENPIGKASIGCVFKAKLWDGSEVAVKVKRPGIDRIVAKDLKVFASLVNALEFLAIVKEGQYGTLYSEVRKMLTEELDWQKEIRYQELFREFHKRNKNLKVTAPKVYDEYCSPSIIVSEFVSGVPARRIMKAMEENDIATLACLEYLDINPRVVAKRLVRACYYAFFECPFYHGDPHPGNIIVQPGNRIVMLDFGACGVFSEHERRILRQMYEFQGRGDVGGMVQCVVKLADPLPPIDVNAFTKDLESYYWHGYYGILSDRAEWWERTSYRLWVGLLNVVREYRVPMPLNTLRMIRATLLYDTVAARLHPKINVFKEYRKYYERYAERVKKETLCDLARQAVTGPDPEYFVLANEAFQTGTLLLFRLRQLLDMPFPSFTALTSRAVHFVRGLIGMAYGGALSTAIAVTAIYFLNHMRDESCWGTLMRFPEIIGGALSSPNWWALFDSNWKFSTSSLTAWVFLAWLAGGLIAAFRLMRKMNFRTDEPDQYLN